MFFNEFREVVEAGCYSMLDQSLRERRIERDEPIASVRNAKPMRTPA
jgi:hypothetical protein